MFIFICCLLLPVAHTGIMNTSSKSELLGEESLVNTLSRLVENEFDVLEQTLEQLESATLAAFQPETHWPFQISPLSAPSLTSAVPVASSSRDGMTAALEETDEEMQALMKKQQLVSIGLDKYARLRTEAADFVKDVDRLVSQLDSGKSIGAEELHEAATRTNADSTSGEDAATTCELRHLKAIRHN